MAGTLIVAVRRALMVGVAGLPEFFEDDVMVSEKWPLGEKQAEMVYTVDPTNFAHTPASLKSGRTFRNEVGTFNVEIRIEGIDMSPEDTADRAVALGTAFEEFVADNQTLFGQIEGLNWVVVDGDGELVELFNEHGSLTAIRYPIKYDARLT
jgi:hypothetical protein